MKAKGKEVVPHAGKKVEEDSKNDQDQESNHNQSGYANAFRFSFDPRGSDQKKEAPRNSTGNGLDIMGNIQKTKEFLDPKANKPKERRGTPERSHSPRSQSSQNRRIK